MLVYAHTIYSEPFLSKDEIDKLHKKHENPPSWMIEQIERDLYPFKEKGITQEMLDFTLIKHCRVEKQINTRNNNTKFYYNTPLTFSKKIS